MDEDPFLDTNARNHPSIPDGFVEFEVAGRIVRLTPGFGERLAQAQQANYVPIAVSDYFTYFDRQYLCFLCCIGSFTSVQSSACQSAGRSGWSATFG